MWTWKGNFCFSALVCVLTFVVADCAIVDDIHGGVKMGIPNNFCDNAKDNLIMDWDNSTNVDYTCLWNEAKLPVHKGEPVTECLPQENFPKPLHKCMYESIPYSDPPPRAGPHRPLWPVYGRYLYIPPQRWVHALEHGAAIFLYHPCGDPGQIKKLVRIAKSCLRRYVITPYKALPAETPYAIVTYGCRLMMSYVDGAAAKKYIKAHAISDGPEKLPIDGQYSLALLEKSQVVQGSDYEDLKLCPAQATTSQHYIQLDDGIDNLLQDN